MQTNPVVSRDEWLRTRLHPLDEEKALDRQQRAALFDGRRKRQAEFGAGRAQGCCA